MRQEKPPSTAQSGVSLIEVLITLVILLVGLLGLAGIQVQAQRAEMESYQRSQALVLVQDMLGRINANRAYAAGYQGVSAGTGAIIACPGVTVAEQDICMWHNALLGSAEQSGGNNVGAMIGARGCVTYNPSLLTDSSGASIAGSGIYTVTVAWQGLTDTAAPTGDTCGADQYGAETKRRIVSLTLRVAALAAP